MRHRVQGVQQKRERERRSSFDAPNNTGKKESSAYHSGGEIEMSNDNNFAYLQIVDNNDEV